MALVRRILQFRFQLAGGTFTESGSNTVTLPPLRASAKIVKAGTPSLGEAQLSIYGMTKSLMNQLSTLGMVYQLIPRNVVTVLAGQEGSPLAVAFAGTITQAWADFKSQPEVPFQVLAHTLGAESVISAQPMSFTGSTDAAGVMEGLAGQMGCAFENNGVSKKLASPYFYGSARAQADACAKAGGFEWFADDTTLAIWPKGSSRNGEPIVVAPPPEGSMADYPSFTAFGISLRNEYDPGFKFGGKIRVKSSIAPANGVWAIVTLAHDLSTLVPGGPWFSSIGAFNPAYPQPVLG